MSLNIKNPATVALVDERARRQGISKTAAVHQALSERRHRMGHGEDSRERMLGALQAIRRRVARLETALVMVSCRGEHVLAEIDLWLSAIEADIAPIDADLVEIASRTWLAYDKGRHPAALTFTDCLSYALATRTDEPLLFIGTSFARTHIEAA